MDNKRKNRQRTNSKKPNKGLKKKLMKLRAKSKKVIEMPNTKLNKKQMRPKIKLKRQPQGQKENMRRLKKMQRKKLTN